MGADVTSGWRKTVFWLMAAGWAILTVGKAATADDFPEVFNTQEDGQAPPTPEEAARAFRVPDGFQVTLFAGEPDVQQPICFAFDDRGRIWVAECYSYAGHGFEGKLRDRIIILADHDGDGRHDERKVFWEGGHVLSSIVWGFGGLYMLEDGKLQHLPDADRDDVPDGPPTVLLDGFDKQDVGHNIVNGLMWGPDGWLYGRHGIQATSHVGPPDTPPGERTRLNASIWRYHPTRQTFEVLTHGTTNPWGLDYNDEGEFFFTNNVIGHLWHMVPGAHYERMYGADFNPHVYELIDQTADHYHWDADGKEWHEARDATGLNDELGGGHSHCGGMIYLGDNWPDEYRGRMFMCNTHGRRINQDILVRQGVSYVAKHGPDFAFAGTPWFRGVQLAYGPDGGVFVSDWSDLGECHDHDGVHRTSGRIYKITYGNPQPVDRDLDVASLSNDELAQLQLHKNDWYVRHARRVLHERAAKEPDSFDAPTALNDLFKHEEPRIRLRALWALHCVNSERDVDWVHSILPVYEDYGEVVDAWLVRLLADSEKPVGVWNYMSSRAPWVSPPRPRVRLHLASSLRKLPPDWAIASADELLTIEDDADDRVQSLMIWYGIEPHVVDEWETRVGLALMPHFPTVSRLIARRLTSEIETIPLAVDELLLSITNPSRAIPPEVRLSILHGISEALRGRAKVPMPDAWSRAYEKLIASEDEHVRKLAQELSVVFGDGRALDDLLQVVQDTRLDVAQRRAALATLAEHRTGGLESVLFNALEDPALAPVAARGLANYEDPRTPRELLRRWWSLKQDAREAALTTLCSRPEYAAPLLDEVAKDEVPVEAIDVIHARQIHALGDSEISKRLEEVWGLIQSTSAEKKQLIERFKDELTDERLASANLDQGRELFQKKCATCHKLFGEGETIGPDLTGSDRTNLHYVLENIIDPSAVVPEAHRMSVVQTASGRTLTGVVLQQTDDTVTLQTEKEQVIVPKEEIDVIEATPQSLMPEGLLSDLSDDEIRDLVGFLGNR